METFNPINQMCHCGHHKDTHFDNGAGDCLGIGCNTVGQNGKTDRSTVCKGYRDRSIPDTANKPPRLPVHASWCKCYDCKKYNEWSAEYYQSKAAGLY